MKKGCCGIGIFGIILHAIGKVIEVTVSVIVYLGLYWPMFYLLVVLGLWLWGGMTFEPSVELALFYVGLALSLLCSVVLTLRHLIFEPFGRYLDRKAAEREAKMANMRHNRKKRRAKDDRIERREHANRYDNSREMRHANYDRQSVAHDRYYERQNSERPLVYRSNRNRNIVIYEYRDRFEVFSEMDRGLKHIDTKWKRRH